jgi:hypothetical protein
MTMWDSGRPSVKLNEVHRLLPALVGLLGIFILELMTPLGIAVWIGYAFPLWYVSHLSLQPAVSLPLLALVCSGLIVAGYFLSPPGINEFYAAVNQTMGVIFLWTFTLRLMRSGAVDDEWLNKAQENLQYSETQFRVMAHEALPSGPRRQTYSSNLLRKQGTL